MAKNKPQIVFELHGQKSATNSIWVTGQKSATNSIWVTGQKSATNRWNRCTAGLMSFSYQFIKI